MYSSALGKGFRSLQLRGRGRWAETAQALFLEFVDDAGNQWYFRPDDGQVDVFGCCELQECVDIFGVNLDVAYARFECGTGVAWGDEDFADGRRLCALPCEGMFSATTADN